jgi:hypothetical protein
VWKLKERPTADELNAACNLRVGQLHLEARDQKYLRMRGIKYVGEIFYIFFDRKSKPSVQTGERIMGVVERQLGLPSDLDPIAAGWTPVYWDERFFALLNTPILELRPTWPIEDWDAFAHENRNARRYWGKQIQFRQRPSWPVETRGIARSCHYSGINFVGQIRESMCRNEHCPAGKSSAGNLNDMRVRLTEIGSTLWAGAVHPPDHVYPDWKTLPIWQTELANIESEKPLYEAAHARMQEHLEHEAKQRAHERRERKAKALKEAEEAAMNERKSRNDKPSLAVLLTRLDTDQMSVRLANCLQNAGLETVGQVLTKTEAQYLASKNFGRKSLNELKELLWEEYGCWLGYAPEKRMQLSDFAECAPSAN